MTYYRACLRRALCVSATHCPTHESGRTDHMCAQELPEDLTAYSVLLLLLAGHFYGLGIPIESRHMEVLAFIEFSSLHYIVTCVVNIEKSLVVCVLRNWCNRSSLTHIYWLHFGYLFSWQFELTRKQTTEAIVARSDRMVRETKAEGQIRISMCICHRSATQAVWLKVIWIFAVENLVNQDNFNNCNSLQLNT